MMLGRFLEISVHAPDILGSIGFWERLGFRQLPVNDAWKHPYAVLTDGHAILGLHAYEFPSPSLTYVHPELSKHLPTLRGAGVKFEFAKTGDDQFHEAGFLSPDGQMVTLLESRTFSPASFDEPVVSLLGEFDGLWLPARRIDRSLPFWARLGLAVLEYDEDAPDSAVLTDGRLRLRLSEHERLKVPTLVFVSDDPDATADEIARRTGIEVERRGRALEFQSPEGLAIVVIG